MKVLKHQAITHFTLGDALVLYADILYIEDADDLVLDHSKVRVYHSDREYIASITKSEYNKMMESGMIKKLKNI